MNFKLEKIGIFTATRAEFGLLKPLATKIHQSSQHGLCLICSGTHIRNIKELEDSQLPMSAKIEIPLLNQNALDIAHSISVGITKYSEALANLKPDIMVVLGDRHESFAMAVACHLLRIPIAHIGGGETTTGAIDDGFRHSITKLATWHFASTKQHAERIRRMGESPKSVFDVGVIGLDDIDLKLDVNRDTFLTSLGFSSDSDFILVTIHPETALENPCTPAEALFSALNQLEDIKIVVTAPNVDEGGDKVRNIALDFCGSKKSQRVFIESLGHDRFIKALKCTTLVIGNSSAGIYEAPVLGAPVINIGKRQDGRPRWPGIKDVESDPTQIYYWIKKALTENWREKFSTSPLPFKIGGCTDTIFEILQNTPIPESNLGFYEGLETGRI